MTPLWEAILEQKVKQRELKFIQKKKSERKDSFYFFNGLSILIGLAIIGNDIGSILKDAYINKIKVDLSFINQNHLWLSSILIVIPILFLLYQKLYVQESEFDLGYEEVMAKREMRDLKMDNIDIGSKVVHKGKFEFNEVQKEYVIKNFRNGMLLLERKGDYIEVSLEHFINNHYFIIK